MGDLRFPSSLKPIVSSGYSQTRGGNIYRNSVQGGAPRQGRDTYYDAVPISVVLIVSKLGRQAFYSFLTQISGGADSFIMQHDTGLGIADHQVWITSDVSDSTQDGINWTISFTATAERTAIQEDTCLAANLPDLFGCYGDDLGCFLERYNITQTTFPRIWNPDANGIVAPVNLLASQLDNRVTFTGQPHNYINSDGALASSAVNEWPLNYVNGVAAGRAQPRQEETNVILSSRNILANPTYFAANQTVSNVADAPFTGGGTSPKFVPNTVSDSHRVALVLPMATTGQTLASSVLVKAAGLSVIQFRWSTSPPGVSDQHANFDLVNLTTGGTAGNRRITPVGNGWFLCSCTTVITGNMSGNRNWIMQPATSASSAAGVTFVGNDIDGLMISHAQVQVSLTNAEPIVTASTTVTRSAQQAYVNAGSSPSVTITYSDASTAVVTAVNHKATIPLSGDDWPVRYITRIDFN